MSNLPINTKVLEIKENKIYLTKELSRDEYLNIKKFLADFEIVWNSAKQCFIGDKKIISSLKESLTKGKNLISRKKDLHFYPTPKVILDFIRDELLGFYDYQLENFSLLEPSAGEGAIADYFRKNFKEENITLVELFDANVEKLQSKGYKNIIQGNFLELEIDKKFDFIIMNPPFKRTEYIDHILKAYELLDENGELIAIMPSRIFKTPFNQLRKKEKELYELVTKYQSYPVYGLFENALEGTNIEVAVVKIDKQEKKEFIVKNLAIGLYNEYSFYNKIEKAKSINEIEEAIKEYIEFHKENYENSMPFPYSYMQEYISYTLEYFEKEVSLFGLLLY